MAHTCPVTAIQYLLPVSYRSGTLYPVTTHGDAVGPSANRAVAPEPDKTKIQKPGKSISTGTELPGNSDLSVTHEASNAAARPAVTQGDSAPVPTDGAAAKPAKVAAPKPTQAAKRANNPGPKPPARTAPEPAAAQSATASGADEPATPPAGKPTPEPTAPQATEAAEAPGVEPNPEPITTPVAKPATEPGAALAAESGAALAAESSAEPVAESTAAVPAEPAIPVPAEPAAESGSAPAAKPAAEVVDKAATGPAAPPAAKPADTAESTAGPTSKSAPEAVEEAATEPTGKTETEAVGTAAAEPVAEPPATSPTGKPSEEPAAVEPAGETAISEPTAEVAAEPAVPGPGAERPVEPATASLADATGERVLDAPKSSAEPPEWPPATPNKTTDVPTSKSDRLLGYYDPLPPADEPASAVEPTRAEPAAAPPAPVPAAVVEEAVFAPLAPVEPPKAVGELATALSRLRAAIGGAAYPLVMPSADEAKRVGAALVSQLDDYLLPRLARLDAPLLVVVGGSTGAGKSTLVNSLIRAPVSAAGVLRPTTRSPVLVSHPSDLPWFRKGELLPGLTRTAESSKDANTLQLVAAPALGAGLAFLDAPDIDSVVDRNRELAAQLLAAADLWLFVTTASRYADAVPWELLKTARLRGTVIALVLDRVPPEAAGEVTAHLGEMLAAYDMAAAPMFVLSETLLDGNGLLSEDEVKPLHDWFAKLASDSTARAAVVRQTLDGALAALRPATDGLAAAADEQAVAAKSLDERVATVYRTARRTVEDGLRDGRLLRGEVLARWQEFVGTGEFLKTLESRIGHLRDRVVAALTGRPAPGTNLQSALESQLVTLLRGVAADAAEQAYAAWQAHPAGAALLEQSLQRPSPDLPQRAERMVRDWQQFVLDLVRTEAADKRVVARGAAYAVNGLGLAVMIAVFTSTAFIPTGIEVAVGAGTTVAAQKVLEAIFGDQAIRTLATRAREELLSCVNVLLDAEAARYLERTAAVGVDLEPGARLRDVATDVERAREELALTATAPSLPASNR